MKLEHQWLWALLVLFGGAFGLHAARITLRDVLRRRRFQARMRRAASGERSAAKLLERAGYRVIAEQVRGTLEYRLDDEPFSIDVQADYRAEKAGRSWIAEVKTGRESTRLTSRSTRRQLLEYAHAFDAEGVLLVDAERGRVHRVTFPSRVAGEPQDGARRRLRELGLVAVGVVLGLLAALGYAHAP